MTICITVSPELRERIDMLREHVKEDCVDMWGTLASLIEIGQMFDAETAGLEECDQTLRESGYGDLLDLVGIVGLVLDKVGAGISVEHARGVREAHPEWFSETMVGPRVAAALRGILGI